MHLARFDRDGLTASYGIEMANILSRGVSSAPPFAAAWGRIPPGGATTSHMHHEFETLFVWEGAGIISDGREENHVGSGDAIYLPAFSRHTLKNRSATDELLFLSVYCSAPEMALLVAEVTPREGGQSVLVTSTPPTPNGDLHLGHLSGPYIAADVYRRFVKQGGGKAFHFTGSDDFQTYVVKRGLNESRSPADVADQMAGEMRMTLAKSLVDVENFERPLHSKAYDRYVSSFFRKLYESGWIIEELRQICFCENCKRCLFDGYVKGGCPHCGEETYGNICESCARPNECTDLVSPCCTHCGAAAVMRETKQFVFDLGRAIPKVVSFLDRCSMRPRLRAIMSSIVERPPKRIAVSYPTDWGIPVPVEGAEEQRVWVWFEMAPGYIFGAERLKLNERLDAPDVVQFFGIDNGFYHAVLFSALAFASGEEWFCPTAMICNEFYLLDGKKFSTSRQHAIWGSEFMRANDPDLVRLYLCYSGPEYSQSNFSLEEFRLFVEEHVRRRLMPFLTKLKNTCDAFCGSGAPETGAWREEHRRFFGTVNSLLRRAYASYSKESFSLREVARAIVELIDVLSKFGAAETGGSEYRHDHLDDFGRTGLALQLMGLMTLAQISNPMMPIFAERVAIGLDEVASLSAWSATPRFVQTKACVSISVAIFGGLG